MSSDPWKIEAAGGGYWYEFKPPHGWSCDCPETEQHQPVREWVPEEEASP